MDEREKMMKEALEWQEHIRKLVTSTDDELYFKRSKVFDWLVRQAERVEELKKEKYWLDRGLDAEINEMREIKFRGKAKMSIEELDVMGIDHKNGWVYGNLVMKENEPYIVGNIVEVTDEYITPDFWVRVIPETVGQFTGLKDKNGKEIYENDICETVTYSGKPFGTIDVVKFSGGAFKLADIEDALLTIPLNDNDIQSVEVLKEWRDKHE